MIRNITQRIREEMIDLRAWNHGSNNDPEKPPKAVVVGGSIAGISCAHALIEAGWDVVVLEKTCAPPTGSPTGAGLGLDPLSLTIIQAWLKQPQLLQSSTLPLSIEQNQATNAEKKISWILTRDPNFNFRAAHWADLHSILYNSLPSDIVLWGHYFLSFEIPDDKRSVTVKCKVLESGDTAEIVGDLLIAADGCLSNIRKSFLPDFNLRYVNYSNSGNSVTTKVSDEMISRTNEEAEKVWCPELARLMRETREPFLNVIYDADPLKQLFWNNVVLIGDAAHPTTPHGVRSTNMSILDAAVLGKCLQKWGLENLCSALEEYQFIRLPVVSEQVLHSRRVGRIKQGLSLPDRDTFDATIACPEECDELQQKNMPFFTDVPSILKDEQHFGATE
ncbi:OLC1v1030208C1 [Oldenlandia corymbosa var. corymbosa]|uniref:OLC1v1030208C1 n=1 Tax=Oldenlandia corymbosa var. corymbosa TaxID=529605 RepID=A0AAV1CHE2_OLDCO|nr:OLC1v1030208C1 [Oldenlandia corymbosa var. corymbosa]